MKFPHTIQDIDELIDLLRSLDSEDKLYLLSETLQCAEDNTDKHGQIILNTGLMWDGDDVRKMKEEDFKEKECVLDL